LLSFSPLKIFVPGSETALASVQILWNRSRTPHPSHAASVTKRVVALNNSMVPDGIHRQSKMKQTADSCLFKSAVLLIKPVS
jgi:hypothetical protein